MNRPLTTVLLFVTTAAATAQQVSLNPVVVSPLTTLAVLGSVVDAKTANVVPPVLGSLASSGVGNESTVAIWNYWPQHTPLVRELRFNHFLDVTTQGTQPAFAAAAADLRFELSATSSTNVRLQVVVQFQGSPGVPLPLVTIDLGDDGFLELQGIGTWSPAPFAIGPIPTPVRVHAASQLGILGSSQLNVTVSVRPGDTTQVTPQVSGCSAFLFFGTNLLAAPGFGESLYLEIGPPASLPVLVLGLGLQPVLLPPLSTLAPCLLLPSTDIVLPMPNSSFGYPTVVLSLPPTVRPVTFWAQAVLVEPYGLFPTDAYRVDAL